ncbi:MAG: carbamoyl phosphate synthase small subunit [Lachnospiraceae bacterium]|jgi:carbamoyl-phosphate synthase small subunit|nr:carbamoyl phosphate synthase small subunit [Lachnospiraceae bacterium]
MQAFLILEDGTVFKGSRIGADRDVISEIVFNTSMAGYPEVLTDPSYEGQSVCMTYPLIGNYGICTDDMESSRPWMDALIVREAARVPSNFRSDMSLLKFMEKYELPGIEGIDTRALTRILRERGTMNGMITSDANYDLQAILPKLKAYTCGKVVEKVSCSEKYTVKGVSDLSENGPLSGRAVFDPDTYHPEDTEEPVKHEKRPSLVRELTGIVPDGKGGTRHLSIALLDVGAKRNIAGSLAARGCDVTVYPALTAAEEILASHPDGIMLSNGPGDPKECTSIIEEVRRMYESDVPIFAICLGHQLMALATGADTHKLKYGHRGGNHPVKDLSTGRVYISSQNHGYVVDTDTLDPSVAVPAFVNVNDGTNEGLRYLKKNVFTVQFHPEACPGPQDSGYLFDRFLENVKSAAGMSGVPEGLSCAAAGK